jgi:hypothetical protein
MHLKILILMQRGGKNSSVDSRENSRYPCQWPMHPTISLYLIRPSHWRTTSGRKRTAKGSSATARTMWNHTTRSTTHLKAVDMAVHTSMGAISAKGMVVTSMAIRTMEDSGEITPVVIAMDTNVEEIGNR